MIDQTPVNELSAKDLEFAEQAAPRLHEFDAYLEQKHGYGIHARHGIMATAIELHKSKQSDLDLFNDEFPVIYAQVQAEFSRLEKEHRETLQAAAVAERPDDPGF